LVTASVRASAIAVVVRYFMVGFLVKIA
jgi:hypothetical protein